MGLGLDPGLNSGLTRPLTSCVSMNIVEVKGRGVRGQKTCKTGIPSRLASRDTDFFLSDVRRTNRMISDLPLSSKNQSHFLHIAN